MKGMYLKGFNCALHFVTGDVNERTKRTCWTRLTKQRCNSLPRGRQELLPEQQMAEK